MKVIYVGGTCDFCEYVFANYSNCQYTADLVKGRAYTIVMKWEVEVDGHVGWGVRLAEIYLPPNWGHCSCQFREIDGDRESFYRMMRENRPKTKELEPA